MKVGIIYFSATNNTKAIAEAIKKEMNELGTTATTINIAPYKTREEFISVESFDALIFGFPVWASVIPKVCRDWLLKLKGENKLCAMFFNYGGVTVGISHYHTKLLLNKQGFKVVASAEFLGKHTFNVAEGFEILPERPNEDDFTVAKEYAKALLEIFENESSPELDIDKPETADKIMERIQQSSSRVIKNPPTRNGKECSMCRTCEDNCPTQAFNADTGESDGTKCIQCMSCVVNCPDQILTYPRDMSGLSTKLLSNYGLTEETANSLESKYLL